MNIQITGRHIEVTEPIRDFIHKRVEKFPKLVGPVCDFSFILTVERHRQIADVVLTTKQRTFTAAEDSKDLYASISSAVEKLEKQVRKTKERRQDKSRSTDKVTLHEKTLASITDMGAVSDLAANPTVVNLQMDTRPMAVEEAIHELQVSAGSFVVFVNSGTEKINVLYRRKDGNYGLIFP
ncbi:MAG: ribosome-associated translation inhibitor RaiA [Acidobacteria bacterium]|nr:ribosome-associated translation inhibitor RaiA [Acidobacteriota bacterium]